VSLCECVCVCDACVSVYIVDFFLICSSWCLSAHHIAIDLSDIRKSQLATQSTV